jgi:hypothetical protein
MRSLDQEPWRNSKTSNQHPTLNSQHTRNSSSRERKQGVIIPPFLTKILMDVDSEDPFILLKACCKVLKDFDKTPEMVEASDGQG